MSSTLEHQIHQLERDLRKLARRQAGCQALMTQFGVGELIALTLLTELGDVTRTSSSRKAVSAQRSGEEPWRVSITSRPPAR